LPARSCELLRAPLSGLLQAFAPDRLDSR
jgi:hypothetical protein